ncbi:hypothetical protein TRVL_01303 [Trypanosoma vivax]|nr:hypothetical protein TRVL_01303 [Trypanosoma vivax]
MFSSSLCASNPISRASSRLQPQLLHWFPGIPDSRRHSLVSTPSLTALSFHSSPKSPQCPVAHTSDRSPFVLYVSLSPAVLAPHSQGFVRSPTSLQHASSVRLCKVLSCAHHPSSTVRGIAWHFLVA